MALLEQPAATRLGASPVAGAARRLIQQSALARRFRDG
jgi:hypothetical protein